MFFYHHNGSPRHNIKGKTVRDSARLAIREAKKKWDAARIPVRQEIRGIEL